MKKKGPHAMRAGPSLSKNPDTLFEYPGSSTGCTPGFAGGCLLFVLLIKFYVISSQ